MAAFEAFTKNGWTYRIVDINVEGEINMNLKVIKTFTFLLHL